MTPANLSKHLQTLLSSPNIASKEPVYAQYDHEVGIRTIVRPGLHKKNQIVFKYANKVNGSEDQIAGVCNSAGNVVGMMPHPERAAERELNPSNSEPASLIFKSLVGRFS